MEVLARILDADVIHFPNYGTETGRLIRALLKNEFYLQDTRIADDGLSVARADALVLQALMTANRYECADDLAARACSSRLTVLDRYWTSGYAYGVADGLDGAWLEVLHALLPAPIAWVLIDVSPEESARRRPERRDAYEADAGRLARARAAYLELFERRRGAGEPWRVVDGERPVEEVAADVRAIVEDRLRVVGTRWEQDFRFSREVCVEACALASLPYLEHAYPWRGWESPDEQKLACDRVERLLVGARPDGRDDRRALVLARFLGMHSKKAEGL